MAGKASRAASAVHLIQPFSPAVGRIGNMDLSYPIGRFDFKQVVDPARYAELIEEIAAAPGAFRAAVQGLDEAQLETPYRPGGWTVRQTVHHVADSHMNSFI